MFDIIYLSPAQQKATQEFTRRVGVVKKPRSLQPELVLELAPEQLYSTKLMKYELFEYPAGALPQRVVILSEVQVHLKGKYVAWYTVLQLEPEAQQQEFMAVFNHSDYALRSYQLATRATTPVVNVLDEATGELAPLPGPGSPGLMQTLHEAEAGFLFNPDTEKFYKPFSDVSSLRETPAPEKPL